MSFSDHKITQFTHRISELADQPNLPADELKARFDSSPEELRKSLNAVCDDADSLENRVDSIITQTFEGVVDKSMLAESLAAELDAKATQAALAEVSADVTAEATARESGDSALSTRLTTLESAMPSKVEVYSGSYIGNNSNSRTITLGFQPRLLFLRGWSNASEVCFIAGENITLDAITLTATGFRLTNCDDYGTNRLTGPYAYLAFK